MKHLLLEWRSPRSRPLGSPIPTARYHSPWHSVYLSAPSIEARQTDGQIDEQSCQK